MYWIYLWAAYEEYRTDIGAVPCHLQGLSLLQALTITHLYGYRVAFITSQRPEEA